VRRSTDVAVELGAAGINVEHSLVDAALVARAGEVGLGVWVFIVDDAERFAELIDMGVTAVTTHRPARMLAMVGSRSSAATKETDG
jgi:glycerophosphoryl diester phosphodiesterase